MSKPEPAPTPSEFNRFDVAAAHAFNVPKAEVDRRIEREKKEKGPEGKKRKAG